jgi:(p)ppGpp synthase/HD superfamily hydrolase
MGDHGAGKERVMAISDELGLPESDESNPSGSLKRLINLCAEYMATGQCETVYRAYSFAAQAHAGVYRQSGEPYIEHPIAVASWLAERQVEVDGIVAALLHDVVEDTPISLARISHRFGSSVALLVDGVTKFEAIEQPDERNDFARVRERKRHQQAETFRKLLLAMAEDPRVALVKLADRVHNMRTLGATRLEKQAPKARETSEIYVPLARRLGMGEVMYELQDLALKYIDPRRYEWLSHRIKDELAARSYRTEATLNAIRHVMTQHDINATVTAEQRSLSSINRRIAPSDMDVSEVTDLVVYRVLVETRRDCYAALLAIHSQWQQLDTRLRDYIGSPKLNGYQSLHTTVFGFEGLFDVHIRTYAMQRVAEHGLVIAADVARDLHSTRIQALNWIDQVHSWQQELSLSAVDFIEAVQGDLFHEQIFVFTPKGEVRDLPVGSTVLDMAYRIHTELGAHCSGAKVTGSDHIVRSESPDYTLNSGDIVHIETDPVIRPNASWLRIAKTRHARDAISHYLHTHGLPEAEVQEEPLAVSQNIDVQNVHLGFCCEPGPEDELIGFIKGRNIVVHRAACRYALQAVENNHNISDNHCAYVTLKWDDIHPECYRVSLYILGFDRSGLLHDVARVMADADLNLVRVGAHSIDSRIKALISMTVEVQQTDQLQRACQRLMGVDGVVSVERRDRLPTPKKVLGK